MDTISEHTGLRRKTNWDLIGLRKRKTFSMRKPTSYIDPACLRINLLI